MTGKIDLKAVLNELGPRFAEGAAAADAGDTFVADNYAAMKQARLFSALVPSEYGGGGASHSEMCAFLRALAPYCASTALALSMHQHLVAAAMVNDAAGRPGRKVLDKVAGDESVLVSTGANDWMESNGTMTKVEGGHRVSARKPFGSGSPAGAVLVTSAPYEDPEAGWQVLHFPVPLAAEGASLAGDWKAMGMRGTGSHTVILEDVFVPEEAIAMRRGRGEYTMAWNVIVTVAMPLIMSVYVGVAEAAAGIASKMAAKRASDPATVYLLGELTNTLTSAQLTVDDMVRIANDGDFDLATGTADAILVRKTLTGNAVIATVEKALETAGGAGFFRPFGLERLARDAHGARFHPLPEKKQLAFTGRLALGLDPVGHDLPGPLAMAAE